MIADSQHRHTVEPQTTNIEIDEDESGAMERLAEHLVYKLCPLAPVMTAKTQVPMNFTVEPGSNVATVVCGFCNRKMGTCKIKYECKK